MMRSVWVSMMSSPFSAMAWLGLLHNICLRPDAHYLGRCHRPCQPPQRVVMCGTLFLFAQANFDPIGRDGCSLDNVPDEAFHLDGRRGEPSLGKPECISQGRIKRVRAA